MEEDEGGMHISKVFTRANQEGAFCAFSFIHHAAMVKVM